ncbi:DUF1772 domain-containing protein [Flavobacterium aestivum]|uniref:anthrone oxygenase family protein n=1 Tax=Flavobacterium aestivum TaxID=3003257 RepID=UPI002482238D|nr:anthrone oxygenase family protein [Flavobacterium aestivum]
MKKTNMNICLIFQIVAVLATGLVAGLFYGYSCSVNSGLGNLSDEKYLEAFQSINRVIQNPMFFLSFMGSVFILPISSYLMYRNGVSTSFYLLIGATLVYLISVFGVTVVGNVPLNDQLDKFSILSATANEISAMRKAFETPWNAYHSVRTIGSVLSFVLAVLSIIKLKI